MNKYRNKKVTVNGIKFDSIKESRRYFDLTMLERAGEISQLELQPKYYLSINGVKVCSYTADFKYRDKSGALVVEDVKSPATAKNPVYRLKKKLMFAIYGIEIQES